MKPKSQSVLNLTPTKRGLLAAMLQREGLSGRRNERISRAEVAQSIPASFAQQGLWLIDQLGPGQKSYIIPMGFRLEGPLDMVAFERSVNEIVRRHESLRTTFSVIDGQPTQVIAAPLAFSLPVIDLRRMEATQCEAELARLSTAEAQQPFDLSLGPLLRASLVRTSRDAHIFLLTMHHIISDGWSMGLLFWELSELYNAFSQGRGSPLAEPELQYADFAIWQRERLRVTDLEEQLSYWRKQLSDLPGALELPTERLGLAIENNTGAKESFLVSRKNREQLNARSQAEGVTMFMTLLAAFQILLSRYSGEDEIVIGTPGAGREREETQAIIGLFVNTLVLRTSLAGDPTFRELLARVKEVVLGAHDHQDLPFTRLVEELRPNRGFGQQPFFQIMFGLQQSARESPMFRRLQCSGWQRNSADSSKCDLALSMSETGRGLSGTVEYNARRFKRSTIQRLVVHYTNLLDSICLENPRSPVQSS